MAFGRPRLVDVNQPDVSGPSYPLGSSCMNFGKVRSGRDVVSTWARNHVCQAPAVALFDKHGVIDTLDETEAQESGIDMDHAHMPYGLCSWAGRGRARETCNGCFPWSIFLDSCDFLIFTDEVVNSDSDGRIDVYRDRDLPDKAIRIRGDKGDAAHLLGVPVVVFDDRVDHLRTMLEKTAMHSEAWLVERGEQRRRNQEWRSSNCTSNRPDGQWGWAAISRRFFHEHRAAAVPGEEYFGADNFEADF